MQIEEIRKEKKPRTRWRLFGGGEHKRYLEKRKKKEIRKRWRMVAFYFPVEETSQFIEVKYSFQEMLTWIWD